MNNINHYNKLNNPYLTDINWIKYNQYSCRYDSFLTMFIFCMYEYISLFTTKINIHIKFLLEKTKKIIKGEFEIIDEIWKYFIKENIDILKTNTINGIKIIVDDGFHEIGYVNQLYKIFENEELFCIKIIKKGECINCNYKNIFSHEYLKPLISINSNYLNIFKLENIINFMIPASKTIECPNCNLNIKSFNIIYEIENLPKYLFFLFDYDNYSSLLGNKKEILKLVVEEFVMNNILNYILLGGITMSNDSHFTCFISKINNINNLSNKFDKDKIYYHDGIKNYGKFLKYNSLNEIFTKNKKLVPYILLYSKK